MGLAGWLVGWDWGQRVPCSSLPPPPSGVGQGIFFSPNSERGTCRAGLRYSVAHWSGKGRVGFPCFPGDIKSYLAPDPRASCWGCGCQLIEEVFPEGSPGPFRKTSLGLLIPQPLALPLRDDPGVRPLTLEGDQEPASSSSLAPQLLLSILRYLTPLGHFQALSPQVTSSRSPGP